MTELETLLAVFRDEAAETCDALVQLVGSLRTARGKKRSDAVTEALRVAHSLKGAAASVGHEELAGLCHELESLLAPVAAAGAAPDEATVDALLAAISVMERAAEVAPTQGVFATSTEGTTEGDQAPSTSLAEDRSAESSLRVEARRLDRLMAHTGELLVTQSRMAGRNADLRAVRDELTRLMASPGAGALDFGSLARELDLLLSRDRRDLLDFGHLTQEMSDALKRVRMVPLRNLAPSWRRAVRNAAHDLNRQVDLEVEVGDLEIDKLLLDRLRDPLLHLLRNAVSHGIEPLEEREAAGKPARGRVQARAEMQGAMVLLQLSDDGRGIDPAAIAAAALEKGLIDAAQCKQMGVEEALSLLFRPGFSTAAEVNRVSGRGVGLDVVRQEVEKLGGTVRLAARAALGGTTFELLLPVTLLSTRELLARAGQGLYAIPIENVLRVVVVDAGAVTTANGSPAALIDGFEPVRLRWLSSLMGERRVEAAERLNVVVVRRGVRQVGLVVQEVLGEGEFVTKPLPWNVEGIPQANGAIVRDDGSLALALDVSALLDAAEAGGAGAPHEPAGADTATTAARILVVDDSLTARTLARNTLSAAGFDVSVCPDGEQAWQLLQREGFDLLVSDVKMPGLDGCELTRRVRANARLRRLPVVLVTTLGAAHEVARGAEVGADEYIVKGDLAQRQLLEAVSRLV